MERWASAQLEEGDLNWEALPRQLQRSGAVLRSALDQPTPTINPTSVVVHGLSRLVSEPEFESTASLRPLLELIDDEPCTLISRGASARVWIGDEHPQPALEACAVVQAPYRCNEGLGHVALVGPMRMAYATARAAVQRVARHLELLLA